MIKRFLLFIFLLSFISASSVNQFKILELLNSNKYKELNSYIDRLYKDYKADITKERELLHALKSFDNPSDVVGLQVKKWLDSMPGSLYAHFAMAQYYIALGWKARGSKFISSTTKEQILNMKKEFIKAKKELDYIVSKDPNFSIAYASKVIIDGILQSNTKEKVFKEAIKQNPLSSVIRTTYLYTLLPKWGGSYEEIEEVLNSTKKLYSKNPALKIQEGYLKFAKADTIIIQGQDELHYKEALKYLNEAISKSKFNVYINERAWLYKKLNMPNKAIKDYSYLIKNYPGTIDYYLKRAKIFYKQRELDLALKDLNEILKYDMFNNEALYLRGAIYQVQKDYNKAIDDYKLATIGSSDYRAYRYLGEIYFYKKEYKNAIDNLNLAISYGAKEPDVWYKLTASQWYLKDCNFVLSAYKYKESCDEFGGCETKKLEWAIKSANFAKDRVCKNSI